LVTPVELYNHTNVRNIDKIRLSWPQAIVRYPKIKAYHDADKDGYLNAWDCKPFNEKKHGLLPLPVVQSAAVAVAAAVPLTIMEKKRRLWLKEIERRKAIDRQGAIERQKRIEQWEAARAAQISQDTNPPIATFDQIRAKAWETFEPGIYPVEVQRTRNTEFDSERRTTVVRRIFDPSRGGVPFDR